MTRPIGFLCPECNAVFHLVVEVEGKPHDGEKFKKFVCQLCADSMIATRSDPFKWDITCDAFQPHLTGIVREVKHEKPAVVELNNKKSLASIF